MKAMKYILQYVILCSLILFTSCDLSEVNENPNDPTTAPTPALFAPATKKIMNNVRTAGLSTSSAMLYSQHLGNNNYTEADRYSITNTVGNSGWGNLYAAITTFNEIIMLNTNEATKLKASLDGDNDNQIATCRVLKVWAFHVMTDIWGDIPYHSTGSNDPDFNACLAESGTIYAKYASQQKIYEDLLKELKDAVAMMNYSASGFVRGDVIYSGNMKKWQKFANSLSLRIANRIKHKSVVANSRLVEIMNNPAAYPVMESNADNAVLPYDDKAPNQAPFYSYTKGASRDDYVVTNTTIEFLKGERGPMPAGVVDPRIHIYAQPTVSSVAAGTPEYIGGPYGLERAAMSAFGFTNMSKPGTDIYEPDFEEVFMEYAEVQFIFAENKGWDQASYENGVRASMEKWGVPAADIATYLATLPAATRETVLAQKWIALFMQPNEAWSEIRRTGYPDFLVVAGDYLWTDTKKNVDYYFTPLQGSAMPRRLFYPNDEQLLNKVNYQAALAVQGNDFLDTNIWWDK